MHTKAILPVLLISAIAVVGSSVLLLRDARRVHHLTIATGGAQGQYYAFGRAIAQTLKQREPDIQLEVLETAGSQENMERIADRSADLGLVQSDTPVHPSVRAIAYVFPEMFHLIADQDAGINTVTDIQGKRIALMPEGSGSYDLFWKMIGQHSLDETDFDYITLPPREAHQALLNNDVDALFQVIALGSEGVRTLLQSGEVELVPIDRADALQLSLPFLEVTQIPKGTYGGQVPIPDQDLTTVAVRALLVTHAETPASIVYAITQVLYDFRNDLVTRMPLAANIRFPEAGENLGLPIHNGAQSYYNQDKPNFLVEYAEALGFLLSVTVLGISGLWQFRLWLVGRQKNRADMYNLEILKLIDQVECTQDLAELARIRHHLFEILEKVVIDLDEDRISATSFQSFTFPWDVAIAAIRHRETLLTNLSCLLPAPPSPSEK
jgi:uncharacterized protein